MDSKRKLRVYEFAERVGYKTSTIRKKLYLGEIAYYKVGRIIVIPETECDRILGELHQPVSLDPK